MQPETVRQTDDGLEFLRRILLAPVYDVAKETELSFLARLSGETGHEIYLKREDQQPVHSFKLRGAYNKLASLSNDKRAKGVVAASAGNHAQGVALAAQKLGIKATIVMPQTTPEIKVQNVRRFGAKVQLSGTSFNEANQAAIELAEQSHSVFIPPFDDEQVIAGQGTLGKELLQQLPDADRVYVPVGGGGLLAGVATYLKQLNPAITIIGVEAEDSACLTAALDEGKPVSLQSVGLFADGVAVKQIGEVSFNLINRYCDRVIQVSNDAICGAIKEIFEHTRVIAEPAGALALAGLMDDSARFESPQKMIAVLSGANMNFHTLRYVSERCELAEKKEAILSVTIPEQKGSFKQFCRAIGGRVITEFNYRYADSKNANIFVGIKLTEGEQELANLKSDLQVHYEVTDFTDNELAKLHIRYMVGGQSPVKLKERLFRFEFPEYPGALEKFLANLGEDWNISLFHYRNHGSALGQVLAGFEVEDHQELEFFRHLKDLGYPYHEESDNQAYQQFLR